MSWEKEVPAKKAGDGEPRPLPRPEHHGAVLVGIIDLGHQKNYFDPSKEAHQLLLVWELTDEQVPGTKIPFTLGQVYTYSYHEKANLRKLVAGWRGKDLAEGEKFTITKMLGVPCLVKVIHEDTSEGKTFAKIGEVSAWSGTLIAGKSKPVASIKPLAWTFTDGTYPGPGWVPFVFGKPIKEVLNNAKETRVTGKGDQPGFAPGTTPDMSNQTADEIPF